MDTTITPDEHASNIATAVAVAGTPGAGAPALPDNHLLLAEVEVVDSATTILDADITDYREQSTINSKYVGETLEKATGAELDTATDDAKYATAKALKDSHNIPSVAPSTSGNVLTSNGTDWISAAPSGATDGWTADTDTWVYVSASTFKVEGKDVTTKFTKGTRLKFTQTTAKYAVVIASSFSTDTTVTILTNTDYTIANATITSPYYSYQMSPQGYPGWFNVAAPTWNVTLIDNGSGGQPTTTAHKVAVNGNTLEGWIHGSGTKAGANWYFGYTNPYGVTPIFSRGIGSCNAYWSSTDYSGVVNYDGLIYLAFESDRSILDNQAIAGFYARFSFQF